MLQYNSPLPVHESRIPHYNLNETVKHGIFNVIQNLHHEELSFIAQEKLGWNAVVNV